MSDAFNVATHVPMSRAGFEAWLESAPASPGSFGDWDQIYRGWYWAKSSPPRIPDAPSDATVRALLAERVLDAETLPHVTLLRHVEDHLVFFDMKVIGPNHAHSLVSITLLRQTVTHLAPGAEGYILYWAELGGHIPTESGVISMCRLDSRGSRFVTPTDLGTKAAVRTALGSLQPASALLKKFAERISESSYPNPDVLSSPDFVDPFVFGGSPAEARKARAKKPARKPVIKARGTRNR